MKYHFKVLEFWGMQVISLVKDFCSVLQMYRTRGTFNYKHINRF